MSCAEALYLDSFGLLEPSPLSIKMANKRMSLRSRQEEALRRYGTLNARIFIRCEHEIRLEERARVSSGSWKMENASIRVHNHPGEPPTYPDCLHSTAAARRRLLKEGHKLWEKVY